MVWGQFLALIRVCWSKVIFEFQKWTGWAQTHDFGLILSVFDVFGPILSTFEIQKSLLTNKLDSAQKIDPKTYKSYVAVKKVLKIAIFSPVLIPSSGGSKAQKWPFTFHFRFD